MEFCIVKDGLITNIIECDSQDDADMFEAIPSYAGARIGTTYAVPATDEEKATRIAQSKEDLAAYLEAHPIQWTDGEYYAITAEKQQWLTGKLVAAQAAKGSGQLVDLTWNSVGEVCKPWTLEELTALGLTIEKRVTALVTYQQTQEKAMRDAATQEELDSIVVDYDSVRVQEVPA